MTEKIPGLNAVLDETNDRDEVPGDISDEMWAELCGDQEAAAKARKLALRAAKRALRRRAHKAKGVA